MSDALRQAVEEIHAKIKTHLDEVADLKRAANALSRIIGTDAPYSDVDADQAGAISPTRADAYYGKPLSTAAREYLVFRKQACAPEEILQGLVQGGFDFDGLGWTEPNRLRNLSISMSKNTAIFRRLPNGMFGLKAWYQDMAVPRRRGKVRFVDEVVEPTQQPDSDSEALPLTDDDLGVVPLTDELELDEAETGSVDETTKPETVA
jgi:hypothetical protein